MLSDAVVWIVYIAAFVYLARRGKDYDVSTSGTVSFVVQAFAYVATYVSAVALIGFAGLAYLYGIQITLVGIGVAILGTYFVYKNFAWETKLLQMKLKARSPAQLLSIGHNCKKLRVLLGTIFALFLSVYASGVLKGAAVMLVELIPLPINAIIWGLAIFVGVLVWWGGLRGVLYTEAMQGAVMFLGILMLVYAVFNAVGGPIEGYKSLAALAATERANNGFVSLSSGSQGLFVLSLVVVMSIATWSQPQIIQRHFAISDKKEINKTAIIASLTILILLVGSFYIGALSRLIIPNMEHPDAVMATLTEKLLPGFGQQIFTLAIISASISTTTALYHIVASSLSEDITGKSGNKTMWMLGIVACVCISASTATLKGQIIALLCTTAWSVIGATSMVAYVALIKLKIQDANAAWLSSIAGFGSCTLWYLLIYPSTAIVSTPIINGLVADIPPFIIGIVCSVPTFILAYKCKLASSRVNA